MDAGSSSSLELPQQSRQFTLSEIHLATQDFDESLVIGRGGFGKVYKGTITVRATHLVAAIKRLDPSSNQGAEEFWAEVHMLSKLRHCHLVSLIGYCNDGQEMILVYEYMPRGTLEDHLHKFKNPLSWIRRLKICIGAARGLDYLHTGTGIEYGVIHRDVKSSNILLDDNWAAKISDFGLSKIGPINQTDTYVKTFVRGTFGYLDPNYFQTGKLTRKSDVYALGVVLLEVLSGKQAVDRSHYEDHRGLVDLVQETMKEGRLKQIVDCNIRERILPKCLKKFAKLANRCVHSNPKQRPTMAEGVTCLESVLALQEKANHTLQPSGLRIFGNKVPMLLSWSNVWSKRCLGLYLDSMKCEKILRMFEFRTINAATKNFSEYVQISDQGGGTIYMGTLQNGQRVSVVKYDSGSRPQNIKNEVELMVKLDHENLLKFLGYCIEERQVFLVYEFALWKSLDGVLYDHGCALLDWNKREKIIHAVARVLFYLHQLGVVHGNVKTGSILLNESFDPKLSDFGLARILPINEVDCVKVDAIHQANCLSTKDDVYGFGVLILETMAGYGKQNFEELKSAWRVWWSGKDGNVFDTRFQVNLDITTRLFIIGLLCTSKDATNRPTLEKVVAMLTNKNLPLPTWIIIDESDVAPWGKVWRKRTLEIYFDTIGGENGILLRRFDFGTIFFTNTTSQYEVDEYRVDGSMYKARLKNGQGVSIARYNSLSTSNEELLVKLNHENVLKLLGYFVEGKHISLVYEFALWKSLNDVLFDPECALLDWNKRKNILLGVARALFYLHQHAPTRIIHGDVTVHTILLDESFDPKLSYFENARCLATNQDDYIKVDRVYGTMGYMAPEYLLRKILSTKADVFSFGVLILVTISGCKAYFHRDGMNLIQYVWTNWFAGTYSDILDPRINVDSSSITRFIHIGLLCAQDDAAGRPTMVEVVAMLTSSSSLTLPLPKIYISPRMTEEDTNAPT